MKCQLIFSFFPKYIHIILQKRDINVTFKLQICHFFVIHPACNIIIICYSYFYCAKNLNYFLILPTTGITKILSINIDAYPPHFVTNFSKIILFPAVNRHFVSRTFERGIFFGDYDFFSKVVLTSGPKCDTIFHVETPCGCSSMVEFQPSKLVTWVRFPSPAPIFSSLCCYSFVCAFNSAG